MWQMSIWKHTRWWGVPLTSPAPWKTKVCSLSLFFVIFRAARTPATATDAVPETEKISVLLVAAFVRTAKVPAYTTSKQKPWRNKSRQSYYFTLVSLILASLSWDLQRVWTESVSVPWMSSLKVQYRFLYLLRMRKALLLAKSSNWIRQFIPYLEDSRGDEPHFQPRSRAPCSFALTCPSPPAWTPLWAHHTPSLWSSCASARYTGGHQAAAGHKSPHFISRLTSNLTIYDLCHISNSPHLCGSHEWRLALRTQT